MAKESNRNGAACSRGSRATRDPATERRLFLSGWGAAPAYGSYFPAEDANTRAKRSSTGLVDTLLQIAKIPRLGSRRRWWHFVPLSSHDPTPRMMTVRQTAMDPVTSPCNGPPVRRALFFYVCEVTVRWPVVMVRDAAT